WRSTFSELRDRGRIARTVARPEVPSDVTDIVVLSAREPEQFVFHQGIRRVALGREAARWWVLSACACDHELVVEDTNSIELASRGGSLAGDGFGGLRDFEKRPLRPGDEIQLEALSIEVLEVQDGWPMRIRVRFLPDAMRRVAYLHDSDGALRPLTLP